MKKIHLAVAGIFITGSLPVHVFAADDSVVSGSNLYGESSSSSTSHGVMSTGANINMTPQAGVDPFDVGQKEKVFWTKGELKLGVEKWYGDNTYQIGHPVHWYATGLVENGYFPFSELEFPLDVVMFAARYDLELKNRWMFSFGFKKDLDHSGDDMEDRDWITPANPNRLDIYSDSNVTDFEAYEYDVKVKFKYLMGATWSLDAGIGYLFQKYKYETALKTQYSPSGLVGYNFVWDGRTPSLKYDVYYQIPYAQVGGAVTFARKFTVRANASYAPWVKARDEDQHILRGKVNRGNLDGDSWMVDVEARYQINRNWFVGLEYGYKEIEVDGKMKGIFYGLPALTHTVWEELESTQHSAALTVGYSF